MSQRSRPLSRHVALLMQALMLWGLLVHAPAAVGDTWVRSLQMAGFWCASDDGKGEPGQGLPHPGLHCPFCTASDHGAGAPPIDGSPTVRFAPAHHALPHRAAFLQPGTWVGLRPPARAPPLA